MSLCGRPFCGPRTLLIHRECQARAGPASRGFPAVLNPVRLNQHRALPIANQRWLCPLTSENTSFWDHCGPCRLASGPSHSCTPASPGHLDGSPSGEAASGALQPGGLCTLASPKGENKSQVNYRFYVHICLLFSTLFSYRNNLRIDRIILMHFNLTPLIDNLFVR